MCNFLNDIYFQFVRIYAIIFIHVWVACFKEMFIMADGSQENVNKPCPP